MSLISKIFGDANEKYIKKLQPLIDKINGFEKDFEKISEEGLKEKTKEFKERLANGETLDDILPEAFALVREAAKRTLGQRHFDVQLMGGIALHQGKVAEMKTGEGKTLVATLPLYLNALEGKGCHLVTVNDYLAKRDTVWMGQIYYALGLSVGCIIHETAYVYDPEYQEKNQKSNKNELLASESKNQKLEINDERDRERDIVGGFKVIESYLRPVSRKEAYLADITYGTNNEFGFDYLKDNMVYDLNQQVQRGYNFAIVDEVDSILIDEARTPLIISAPDTESSKMYEEFAKIMPKLNPETDYEIDEKMRAVTLTEQGIENIEKILGMKDIYQEKGIRYLHHLEQALKAEALFKRDRDYVVKDGQIIIVDEFTGRLMPGRRWSGGLHQAIEAKEGVRVQEESLTMATITFQNYFRMYKKLAGMTGTAATSAEEFSKVYKLDVIIIPTNKKMIRRDLPDRVYKTEKGKFIALVREIKERHKIGQPVLVGTRSVEKNEYLGRLLDIEGIPHQILNAKHHEKEGEIIAQAGKFGAVTVATNMAGRGVDILLGGYPPTKLKIQNSKFQIDENEEFKKWVKEREKVIALGGLHVIGTERHEARRIDDQLRGRAGRQGDPGSTQFFVSLEDDLMRIFGGDRIKSLMDTFKIPEDEPIEARLISKSIEEAQSKIEGANFDMRKYILEYDDVMNKHRETIYKKRKEFLQINPEMMKEKIIEIFEKCGFSRADYEKKEKEIGPENLYQISRIVSLRTIDSIWLDHLENMEYLRDSVKLRAYGQQDPLVEYKTEAHRMFQQLLGKIESDIANTILKITLKPQDPMPPIYADSKTDLPRNNQPLKNKVGRNDPCPCGAINPQTGQVYKYKKCGMINAPYHKK
jgi:preprotein translocase subunit SecA